MDDRAYKETGVQFVIISTIPSSCIYLFVRILYFIIDIPPSQISCGSDDDSVATRGVTLDFGSPSTEN